MSIRDKFISVISGQTVKVTLETVGGEEVFIRIPNAAEVRKWFGDHQKLSTALKAVRTNQAIAACYVDENAQPFLTEAEVDQLPITIYQELQTKMMDALGFGDDKDDEEELGN